MYCEPLAQIVTNNLISEPFNLLCGTRQGCPLSPLLFVMSIEPLAIAILNHPGIKGVDISGQEHHISLFADDILLYLADLKNTMPTLINMINHFETFSGFKVNQSKSSILFLNEKERNNPVIQDPFTVSKTGFKYLGIILTPQIKNIVPHNYDPVVSHVNDTLNRWMSLPLTLIGRINVVKMTIPRQPFSLP